MLPWVQTHSQHCIQKALDTQMAACSSQGPKKQLMDGQMAKNIAAGPEGHRGNYSTLEPLVLAPLGTLLASLDALHAAYKNGDGCKGRLNEAEKRRYYGQKLDSSKKALLGTYRRMHHMGLH